MGDPGDGRKKAPTNPGLMSFAVPRGPKLFWEKVWTIDIKVNLTIGYLYDTLIWLKMRVRYETGFYDCRIDWGFAGYSRGPVLPKPQEQYHKLQWGKLLWAGGSRRLLRPKL